jgi:hypothetical protein
VVAGSVTARRADRSHRRWGASATPRRWASSAGELIDSLNALNKAYSSRDRAKADSLKADIKQQVKRLQNAGRAIAKIDKSLLARRVDVPEDVIEQMKTDAAVLGRISSLLITDTVDGFNEAAERLNGVIASWRKLLGLKE